MRQYRRAMWPFDLWSGGDVAFQIVRVKFDQTRREIVTVQVHRALWHAQTRVDISNDAILDAHRANHDLIR